MVTVTRKYRYRLRLLDNIHHLPMDNHIILGRGETCHVQLDDELVSREHARLELHGGKVRVHDLDSRNGTFVNGQKVIRPVALNHGDVLKISFFEMLFEAIPIAQTAPPTLELVYCSGCAAVLTSEMQFCVHCGTPVDKAMSRTCCPTCMAQITPHMHFCTQCGTKLDAFVQ